MYKMKKVLKTIVFFGILAVILAGSQKYVSRHFKYPDDLEDHQGRFSEFFSLEKDTVDALFLGTSHAMYGISPMQIYERHGLVTYNLASSSQHLDLSYALLDEAYHYQHPKTVMLDVSSLFLTDFDNASWRKAIDNLPADTRKLAAVNDYAQAYTGHAYSQLIDRQDIKKTVDQLQQTTKAWISAAFPLYYYHNRWTELNQYDFSKENAATYVKGQYLASSSVAPAVSIEGMNELAEKRSKKSKAAVQVNQNGEISKYTASADTYSDNIPDNNIRILQRIAALCEEHDTQLVLIKIPSVSDPGLYASAWTQMRSNAVKELAAQMDISFVDLLYDQDEWYNFDISTFSADGGRHCNVNGASEVSRYLGTYLRDYCSVEAKENAYYESTVDMYDNIVDVAKLQMTTDIDEYLQMLVEASDRYTIIFAARGSALASLHKTERNILRDGLQMQLRYNKKKKGNSYIACVEAGGKSIYEKLGNAELKHKITLANGQIVSVTSKGSALPLTGEWKASVTIDDTEYALNANGLNIVVLDEKTGQVVDSVAFNGKSAYRNSAFYMLKKYEHALYNEYEAS